jgi:hypothetical protein
MESDSRCAMSAASRRSFLQLGAAGSAALASGILGESFFAASARAASLPHGPFPKDAVIIDANENPLGPCSAAREAIADITSDSGALQFLADRGFGQAFRRAARAEARICTCIPGFWRAIALFGAGVYFDCAQVRDG